MRAIGASHTPVSGIVEAQWVAERRGLARFHTEQPAYSILNRGIERELLPVTQRFGMGTLVWGPLLTGHGKPVDALAFTPDGRTLATGGEDRTTVLWDLDVERTAARICARTDPALLAADWATYFPDRPFRSPCPGPGSLIRTGR
ncbi:aryl-alcohol dehydrogenase-like predicted oxidoreductase [Catenuloplanes nepalensis]|uniref:Aryl-alcohol dehydrogenase-like predicted oxidoreductase n=1 Tax=Catenuloplanes nepalensis TaxID=587533 RepID=A0ABT9MT79_9ACTN|nr:aryl-alcohol dehydrogenase-like predicted oxidoreductase [Catenuloplanes nepalensis]